MPLFAFSEAIRKTIYTTNAVESLYMSLRKVIKTRASFPSEEAALKLLLLVTEKRDEEMETIPALANGAQLLHALMGRSYEAAQQRPMR